MVVISPQLPFLLDLENGIAGAGTGGDKPNRSTFYTSLVEWVLWPELHTAVRMLGGDRGVKSMTSFAKIIGCLKHLPGHFLLCFCLVMNSVPKETHSKMIHEVKFCPMFLLLSREKSILPFADTQTFHMTLSMPWMTKRERDLSFKPVVLKPEPASESAEGLIKTQIIESYHQTSWLSRFGAGPENSYSSQVPSRCWCSWACFENLYPEQTCELSEHASKIS